SSRSSPMSSRGLVAALYSAAPENIDSISSAKTSSPEPTISKIAPSAASHAVSQAASTSRSQSSFLSKSSSLGAASRNICSTSSIEIDVSGDMPILAMTKATSRVVLCQGSPLYPSVSSWRSRAVALVSSELTYRSGITPADCSGLAGGGVVTASSRLSEASCSGFGAVFLWLSFGLCRASFDDTGAVGEQAGGGGGPGHLRVDVPLGHNAARLLRLGRRRGRDSVVEVERVDLLRLRGRLLVAQLRLVLVELGPHRGSRDGG